METTPIPEDKVPFNINKRNVPLVISALESELEHLEKMKKSLLKKKQTQAANDLLPALMALEAMLKYLKPLRPIPLPLK